ncbi:hypothetical protein LT679_05545 [Mucilaginibacter roseus]|uniref:Uncharacterized protein n=1 Tax=Mucilaginibacter roseus TaxID=1528868 RepID=A0ABS8U1Y1_9SPHI|nr:hypothetical protein [Mucilaginibacter roseus]MCD8740058.1 hypothetical protein [Mucilaginibacter roseus]
MIKRLWLKIAKFIPKGNNPVFKFIAKHFASILTVATGYCYLNAYWYWHEYFHYFKISGENCSINLQEIMLIIPTVFEKLTIQMIITILLLLYIYHWKYQIRWLLACSLLLFSLTHFYTSITKLGKRDAFNHQGFWTMQNSPQLIIIKKINNYYICKKVNLKEKTFSDSVYMISTDEIQTKVLVYSKTGQLFPEKKQIAFNKKHKHPTTNTPVE